MEEMISNLYKIKWGKKSQNIRKTKRLRKFNGKLESSGERKRQKGRGNVGESVTVGVD